LFPFAALSASIPTGPDLSAAETDDATSLFFVDATAVDFFVP
jgi:hypothetical protein